MGFLIAGIIIVGAIAYLGGGNMIDGLERDTQNVSDDISRNTNNR